MSAEVTPPELAQLIDVAERPRVGNWSLRAALTRYGQPQPQRTSDLIEVLRRIDVAVRGTHAALEQHGPELWDALGSGDGFGQLEGPVELLRIIRDVDVVGDALAEWADDTSLRRPDDDIDVVTVDAMKRLDALGVPREADRPPRARGSRP